MKRKILTLGVVMALAVVMVMPMAVMASNEGTQEASTLQSKSLNIVGKVADTAVGTITFPAGLPGATINNPSNNIDDTGDPQVVAASSEPVVRIKNGSTGALTVTLEITAWTNSIVASEDYELVDTTVTNVTTVDDVLSADGGAASVDTLVSIPATEYKALYLEVVLGDVGAVSGNSTLSILGES